MSKNYRGVGGIGIEFTECMAQQAISAGKLFEEKWENDSEYYLEELGFKCSWTGAYDLEKLYIFVEGTNLNQINENKEDFINRLNEIGVSIQEKDLIVISDIYVS